MRRGPARAAARARLLLLVVVVWLPACTMVPPFDFERMIYQNKFLVWSDCPYFDDGRTMRTPPEGTIPRDEPVGDPAFTRGVVDQKYVAEIPIPVTDALVLAGRARFESYCAPCHGLRGDGVSVVAENMDLRRPPAIAGPLARRLPAGRIYQVVHDGYGLMRSYAEDLVTPEERWAVVAYLRALQLSYQVELSTLPAPVRDEAERQLR